MTTEPDDLVAWIGELRARVARGDLDGRGRFDVDTGVLDISLAARIMLADLDHDNDLTPEQRQDPFSVERRRLLVADLRRLREHLG